MICRCKATAEVCKGFRVKESAIAKPGSKRSSRTLYVRSSGDKPQASFPIRFTEEIAAWRWSEWSYAEKVLTLAVRNGTILFRWSEVHKTFTGNRERMRNGRS